MRPLLARSAAPVGLVLLYHTVGREARALDPARFRSQMAWLAANATVVDLATLLSFQWTGAGRKLGCAITFDDGYSGVCEQAAPILAEFDFPAIVYVTTRAIGDEAPRSSNDFAGLYADKRMLTWSQARELDRQGIRIGSHLQLHYDLTRLPEAEGRAELRAAKAEIEERIGRECDSFAYPYGKFGRAQAGWVADAGYRTAVSALHQRFGQRDPIDPVLIPRCEVSSVFTQTDFESLVVGDWDFLGYYQRLRRVLAR